MDQQGVEHLEKLIKQEHEFFNQFFTEMEKVIVGQRELVEKILLGLLANGHILIEGLPGLAKTLAVKTFASIVQLEFSRIQFTPDMLPTDLIGAPVYTPKSQSFEIKKGPIFSQILLADEINRAPAKVQSALLEVMQEKQVTIGDQSLRLKEPFLVLATQNDIEQDGTYPLPESQLDRFMLKVRISYPSRDEEAEIVERMSFTQTNTPVEPVFSSGHILKLRSYVDQVYVDQKIRDYILDIVAATREPQRFGLPDLENFIQYGVSPRATLHLTLAAKTFALIQGRGYVRPQDVNAMGIDVLGHRIIESFHARSQNVTADDLVQRILDKISMP